MLAQRVDLGDREGYAVTFHTGFEQARAAGEPAWEMPTVDPERLADLLWTMHSAKGPRETVYP
jgi:hypothetical protein